MQTKALFAILSASLLSLANGAVVDVRAPLDVFVPRIISPNATTTWVIGSVETVTWDTSDAPENISNGAAVTLGSAATPISPRITLVTDFDLRSGSVDVVVPDTILPGNYFITLFGDSGNNSPVFPIVAAYL